MKKLIIFLMVYIIFILNVQAKNVSFAQVTDVRYSNSNSNTLKSVINDINQQKNLDFVVFTGDNIDKPNPKELTEFLKELKLLKKPYYIVIGDKDVNKRKNLGKKTYMKLVHKKNGAIPENPNYVFKKDGVVFIVADGSKEVVSTPSGYYKDEVLSWIDANLDLYAKKNVIILQHFPIISPSKKEMYSTYKAENYMNMLAKHKNVKAIISGHYGINDEQTTDGIVHIITAPVPAYRIIDIVDCDTSHPTIWSEIREVK